MIPDENVRIVGDHRFVMTLNQVEDIRTESTTNKSYGHVDRAASAWLIATYIDPAAEFLYVEDLDDVSPDATAFDMVGCTLTHHGDDVTFETILRRHDLVDPVLWRIAEIVHQADVEDDLFDAPEAAGLDAIVRAIGLDHSDEEVRHITATILSSLKQLLRRETLGAP